MKRRNFFLNFIKEKIGVERFFYYTANFDPDLFFFVKKTLPYYTPEI